jgi:hypothetical protein
MARIGLRTPFGADWEQLELAHVREFLEESVDESLTWEAKGGRITPHDIREAVCGFSNSELGGVVVLGVTQDTKTRAWTVDNWIPPEREVELWISHCLSNGGVIPRPSTDVQKWSTPGGGVLACIAVWPVSVPPAITSSGQVWIRTSSETVKVTNPTLMRQLFDRGSAAVARIRLLSNEAASELHEAPPTKPMAVATLGFAAASLPSEMSAMVFRDSFSKSLRDRVQRLQFADQAVNLRALVTFDGGLDQGGVSAASYEAFHSDRASYVIRARRDGGVAVGFRNPEVKSGALWVSHSLDRLGRMWREGLAVLADMGALGRVHVAARFSDPGGTKAAAQYSDMESVGTDELAALARDVGRAVGRADWEPE